MFTVCDAKLEGSNVAGRRCNAPLFIAAASFIPSAEDFAFVSVVTEEVKRQIREIARAARAARDPAKAAA